MIYSSFLLKKVVATDKIFDCIGFKTSETISRSTGPISPGFVYI